MKKIISYILLGGIISIICYGVYSEIAYTPLKKKDFECLFPNHTNADIIFHKDFIGWSHGDYFELFVYRIIGAEIDLNYPIVDKEWEYAVLSDITKTATWRSCPIDSVTQLRYENEFTWIINSNIKVGKTLQQELEDENNHYCYIYKSELQKYFLLYNSLEGILYYIRQNGF
ncbi:MAG: hypothetical protein Q4F50_12155 [Bacteroides sp.]|uniref:hypothetical protein n=1 Tax=Bacteroides sp. TaxID=29523 RepID=UPI0026DFA66E|nr:hypothetical protein [Bacteroides sp.]MDO5420799.1 hypothetical protein [Bacteroides sp.]